MSCEFNYNQRRKMIDILAKDHNSTLDDEIEIKIKFDDISQKKAYEKVKKKFESIKAIEISSLFEQPKLQAKLIFNQTSSNIPSQAQRLKFDSYEKNFILNDEATFEYFREKALLFSCQLFHRENNLFVFSELSKDKSRNLDQQMKTYFIEEIYKNLTFRKVGKFFLNSEREAVLLNNVFTSHFVQKGFDKIKLIFSKDDNGKKITLLIVSLDKKNEEMQQKLQRKELRNFIKKHFYLGCEKHFYLGCDMKIVDENDIHLLSENEKNLLKNKFDFFLAYAKHCYPKFFNLNESNTPFSSSIHFFGEGKKDNLLPVVKKMLANFSNYLNFTIIVDYDLKKEVKKEKTLLEKLFYLTSDIKINEKMYCAINIFVDYQIFEQLNSTDNRDFTTLFIKNLCDLQEKSSVYEMLLEKVLTPDEKKEFFKYDFDSNSKLFDNELKNFDFFPCYINSDKRRSSSIYTFNYIRKFKKRKNFYLFRYEMHSIDPDSAEEEKRNPSPASLTKTNSNEKSNTEKEEEIRRSKQFNISGFSSNDSKEEIKKQKKKTPKKKSESESSGSNLTESSEENSESNKTESSGSKIKNNSNKKSNKAKEKEIKRTKPLNSSECSSSDDKEEIKNKKKKSAKKKSESDSSEMNMSELNEENFASNKKTESNGSNAMTIIKNNSNEKSNKAKEEKIKQSKPSNNSKCSLNGMKDEIKNKKKKTYKKKSESESSENNMSESSGEKVVSRKKTESKGKNVLIRSNNESEEESKSNKNNSKFSSQEKNSSIHFHSNNRSHTSEQKLKNTEQYEERKESQNNKKDQNIVMAQPTSKKEHTEKFPCATPIKISKKKESFAPKSDDKKEIKQENNICEVTYR